MLGDGEKKDMVIKEFICIFAVFLVTTLTINFSVGLIEMKHLIFPVISVFMIIYGKMFFKNKKEYYWSISLLGIFFCSIFWVIHQVALPVSFPSSAYLKYISFIISLSLTLLIVIKYPWNGSSIIKSFLILIVFSLPILLLWGYYFAAHAWISVESCMAILQTNPSEAENYIADHITLGNIIGIVVAFIMVFAIAKYISKINTIKFNRRLNLLMLLFLVLNLGVLYRTRENIVTVIAYDTSRYYQSYRNYLYTREKRLEHLSQLPNINSTGNKGIYVLVIGESEIRDHMGCYGYSRETTPWLSEVKNDKNFILFDNGWSCACDTVSALTYALTGKNQYNQITLDDAYSLIDIANAAGYDTVWLSNQVQYGFADTPITAIASSAKQQVWLHNKVGHLKDGRYVDMPDFYDESVVKALKDIQYSDRMLIVIHLMGSHNSYNVRYPEQFSVYDRDNKGLTKEEKNTAEYDNSVLYTDYILHNLYDNMKGIPGFQCMIYFSDHGEGIDNHVGHDINKFTYQMTRIPLFMCFSNEYKNDNLQICNLLKSRKNDVFTNDLIFNLMLGIMGVKIDGIDEPQNTFTSNAYDTNVSRFRTLYNKRDIPES